MYFEIYQIIVPLIGLVIVISLLLRYSQSKIGWQEAAIGITFWLFVILVAIFPDFITNKIASFFGIKSNINAIIFLCLGVIFFIIYKLYFMIKTQEEKLTRLTRELALRDSDKIGQ